MVMHSLQYVQDIFTFLHGGEALHLVTGLVTRCLGMQKLHCRLD